MHPTLFEIHGLRFHSYVTLLSLAFLIGTFGVVRDCARRNPPIIGSTRGGFWGFVGALVGAKAFFILQYENPLDLWRAVIIWEGGMVFYGGLIGGILAVWLYLLVHKHPVIAVADTAAPYIALGEALGRLGCYLNGCCWGLPTSMPWGVRFPVGSHPYQEQLRAGLLEPGATASLPVHPAQLYLLVGLAGIYYLTKAMNRRPVFGGASMLTYLYCYGFMRFFVEAVREGPRNLLGLTLSQWFSLGLFIGGLCLFIFLLLQRDAKKSAGLHEDPGMAATSAEWHQDV